MEGGIDPARSFRSAVFFIPHFSKTYNSNSQSLIMTSSYVEAEEIVR